MGLCTIRRALLGLALAAVPLLGLHASASADTGVLLTLGSATLSCTSGQVAHASIDVNSGASATGGLVYQAVAHFTYRTSTGGTGTQDVGFGPATYAPSNVEIISTVDAPAVSGASIVGVSVTATLAANTSFAGAGCGP